MKLLSVVGGRAGIYVTFSDIAPISGLYLPDVAAAISERYAFTQLPKYDPDSLEKLGLAFGMGKFSNGGQDHNIRTLNLYRDGILADCYSTEEAVLMLEDLLKWAAEKFEIRISTIPEGRLHLVSVVIAEFAESVANVFSKFNGVLRLASQMYQATYGVERPVSVATVRFDVDPLTVTGTLPQIPGFVIERELNQPFLSNRFWCQAPVSTQDHIRLLEAFESKEPLTEPQETEHPIPKRKLTRLDHVSSDPSGSE
jgi:hypothetical protein